MWRPTVNTEVTVVEINGQCVQRVLPMEAGVSARLHVCWEMLSVFTHRERRLRMSPHIRPVWIVTPAFFVALWFHLNV